MVITYQKSYDDGSLTAGKIAIINETLALIKSIFDKPGFPEVKLQYNNNHRYGDGYCQPIGPNQYKTTFGAVIDPIDLPVIILHEIGHTIEGQVLSGLPLNDKICEFLGQGRADLFACYVLDGSLLKSQKDSLYTTMYQNFKEVLGQEFSPEDISGLDNLVFDAQRETELKIGHSIEVATDEERENILKMASFFLPWKMEGYVPRLLYSRSLEMDFL
jgi:hypothetical protein